MQLSLCSQRVILPPLIFIHSQLIDKGIWIVFMNSKLPPELSIIVPTFNEIKNVETLISKVESALPDIRWEMNFVDDNSPDGTAAHVRKLARKDTRIRSIERVGRRGLSSACVEGFLASSAKYLAVIDADLQHDERILPDMFKAISEGEFEMAIGSRYVEGGSFGTWEADRVKKSQMATYITQKLLKTTLSDPMSGFFMLRREVFEQSLPNLSTIGFKVLLDIMASVGRSIHFKEIAYEFKERQEGESKLDSMVVWEFFMMLTDKTIGHIIPTRLVSFSIVGGLGIFVHLTALTFSFQIAGLTFITSQAIATIIAMTSNFYLNNILTYRDRRLTGAWPLFKGWLTFVAACSLGAFSNVGIADWLYEQDHYWLVSAVGGVLVGTIWNYVVTALYTWKK